MNFTIFCEGKTDEKLIRDFLTFLSLIDENNEISFVKLEGKERKNYEERINFFSETTDAKGINLVIVDADSDFKQRTNEIQKIGQDLNIEFELFLLPDDQNSGELEDLLLSIIQEDKKSFFNCFEEFEGCIQKDSRVSLPLKESKIYAFLDSYISKNEKRGKDTNISADKRDYQDERFWNLNSTSISPLKKFLQKHLVIQNQV